MQIFKMSTSKLTKELGKQILQKAPGFDRHLKEVNLLRAGNGICEGEFKVKEDQTNIVQTLHGAYIATVADTFTSYALYTDEKCPRINNVSVALDITYLKPAVVGDELIASAKTMKIGKRIAYIKCNFIDKATNELVAVATHTKCFLNE